MRKISLIILLSLTSVIALAQTHKSRIIIEFSREFINAQRSIDAGLAIKKDGINAAQINHQPFDALNEKFKVRNMKRVINYSPAFDERHRKHGLDLFYEIMVDDESAIDDVLREYGALNIVNTIEVEPMIKVEHDMEPFDARFGQQWGLYNKSNPGIDINVLDAWEYTVGDPRVVVAIIDNCFDIHHEDLKDNLWINPGEIANGMDSDGNRYADDIHGWNFRNNNPDVSPDFDRDRHGTHVGGIVAARTNNGIGVAGVAGGWDEQPGISMMVFRCGYTDEASGNEYIGWGYDAMTYAADMGAAIAQCSWGGGVTSTFARRNVEYFTVNGGGGAMMGGLVIAAAGNDNSFAYKYPAAYDEVLAVGSIASNGEKSTFSNYGDWVHISAPGTAIMSTVPYDDYANLQGTSMACPMVSGVAALVLSAVYDIIDIDEKTPEWLTNILVSTSGPRQYDMGGLVNAAAAVRMAVEQSNVKDAIHNANIKVFPNPTTENLTISTDYQNGFAYEVFDLRGARIKSSQTLASTESIDVSNFDAGAYIITIKNNNDRTIRTFIKQ